MEYRDEALEALDKYTEELNVELKEQRALVMELRAIKKSQGIWRFFNKQWWEKRKGMWSSSWSFIDEDEDEDEFE